MGKRRSENENRVFVLNCHGIALDPCPPRTCRKLLKAHKAKVVEREPFTIQLLYETSSYTGDFHLGIDTGQNRMGIAVVRGDEVIWQGEVGLRQDVSELISTRRSLRRSRRSRKTRYRKPRFDNREKEEGSLPPSVQQKVDHNIAWINRFISVLPNPVVHIEIGKFDIQALIRPGIKGIEYQQGDLYGYTNVKYFIYARDYYTCQICGRHGWGVKLLIHHIIYQYLGGTNRVCNLLCVCDRCHTPENHEAGGPLHKLMVKQFQKEEVYKGATFMNTLSSRVKVAYDGMDNVSYTRGYITSVDRERLGIPKSHFGDAIAAANPPVIRSMPNSVVMFEQVRHKKRSLHEATARKWKNEPNRESKRNVKNIKEAGGIRLHDRVMLSGKTGRIGYVTSFTGSYVRVQDIEGNYLRISPKYTQIPRSKIRKVLSHHHNWISQQVPLSDYRFV